MNIAQKRIRHEKNVNVIEINDIIFHRSIVIIRRRYGGIINPNVVLSRRQRRRHD